MALQEFLASYAVQVDESGAKRLKDLLEENRTGAKDAAAAFASAAEAVSGLYAGLTGADGSSGGDLAAVFADLQAHAASIAESFASVRNALTTPLAMPEEGSFLDVLSHFTGEDGSGMEIPVTLNTSEAEKAAQSFVAKVQSLRPALSVNTTGVTSAVASAVSQIRSMLSALQIIVPVTALVRLQFPPGFSGINPNSFPNTPGSGSGGGSSSGENSTPPGYAEGARISSPTLAQVGENADPEYIIPVRNERRAVPLIRALLGELSESGRSAVWDAIRPAALPDRLDPFHDRLGSVSEQPFFVEHPVSVMEQMASTEQPASVDHTAAKQPFSLEQPGFTAAQPRFFIEHLGISSEQPIITENRFNLSLEQLDFLRLPIPVAEMPGLSMETPGFSAEQFRDMLSGLQLSRQDNPQTSSASPEEGIPVSKLVSLLPESFGETAYPPDVGTAFSFSLPQPAEPDPNDGRAQHATLSYEAVLPDIHLPDLSVPDLLLPKISEPVLPENPILRALPEQEDSSPSHLSDFPDHFLSGWQNLPMPKISETKTAAYPFSFPASVFSAPLPDLSSLSSDLSALTAAARMNFFPQGSGGGNQYHSVDAPVTIQVSAPAASPEAVGRSVYDLTQRHILKTLEGVFR